jgi:drug/metabolite transporter (DMT)-like permease|tara:strand:- start:3250 stop:3498 length:249 start_codon:yes stop_codon:yes gene_type:complete
MKIRYYHRIDGWRWLGFILAMIGAFILSGGDPSVQWMGWAVAVFSCSIWIYMGLKDKDLPRALMELMYLLLAVRGIYNWLIV